MAYYMNEKCDGCGICVPLCPVKAITEGTPYNVADNCIDCGVCSQACPQDAPVAPPLPEWATR